MKTRITRWHILSVLIVCIFTQSSLLAKRLTFATPMDEERWWKENGITHSFPDGFNDFGQCGWAYGPVWTRLHSGMPWMKNSNVLFVANILQSDDKQCEIYFPIILYNGGPSRADSLSNARSSWGYYRQFGLIQRNSILNHLLEFKGQDDFKFEDYVTTVGGKMPREYFNADSVFFWNFPIEPMKQEGEKYTECIFMFVWNVERAVGMTFAWFFTDEGKKNKWQYIEKLKKCVWYKEMPIN